MTSRCTWAWKIRVFQSKMWFNHCCFCVVLVLPFCFHHQFLLNPCGLAASLGALFPCIISSLFDRLFASNKLTRNLVFRPLPFDLPFTIQGPDGQSATVHHPLADLVYKLTVQVCLTQWDLQSCQRLLFAHLVQFGTHKSPTCGIREHLREGRSGGCLRVKQNSRNVYSWKNYEES